MKFNWGFIGKVSSERGYEITQAVKNKIPMDEVTPPLDEAEKEYYKLTEYMILETVGKDGDRKAVTFDFTENNGWD